MIVPFNDLSGQHLPLLKQFEELFGNLLKTSDFILGPDVFKFEEEFSLAHGLRSFISCANGTDPLFGIYKRIVGGNRREVIIPAMSWLSTSEAVTLSGGVPVFCDVDADGLLDLNMVEKLVNENTVAINVVHLYGRQFDVSRLYKLRDKFGLKIVEDCAQSHFARNHSGYCGSNADYATFSFYPGKNLGALGDAGGIYVRDELDEKWMRGFLRHGCQTRGNQEYAGINSRMDTIQAGILRIKLGHVGENIRRRRAIADFYINSLSDIREIRLPANPKSEEEHVWHQFTILVSDREALRDYLESKGIHTMVHYPFVLPNLVTYAHLKLDNAFPMANKIARESVSLPIYPGLTMRQQTYVTDSIRKWYEHH